MLTKRGMNYVCSHYRMPKTRRLKRKSRKSRKRTRRYKGGDYRRATTQSMQGVALPRDAGVSIAGRSGIFSVKEAIEYKEAVMNGMRP